MKKHRILIIGAVCALAFSAFAEALTVDGKAYVVDRGYDANGTFVEQLVPLPPGATVAEFASVLSPEIVEEVLREEIAATPRVSLEPVPFLETGLVGAQLRFDFQNFSDFRLLPVLTADRIARRTPEDIRLRAMVAQLGPGEVVVDAKELADLEARAKAAEASQTKQGNSWMSNWGVGGAVGGVVAIVYLLSDSGGGGDNVNIEGDNNTVAKGDSSADGGNKPSTVTNLPAGP